MFAPQRTMIIEPRHDKTNKMSVRPAKTQISLGIRPVWSESSLCAHWVAKGLMLFHADSEDSDQNGRMPKLIWVFAGRTLTLLVLSCCGSISVIIYIFVYNLERALIVVVDQSVGVSWSQFMVHNWLLEIVDDGWSSEQKREAYELRLR